MSAANTVTWSALTRLSVRENNIAKEIVYSNSSSKSKIKLTTNT